MTGSDIPNVQTRCPPTRTCPRGRSGQGRLHQPSLPSTPLVPYLVRVPSSNRVLISCPPPFPPNSSTNQPSFSPPTWQSGGEGHECSSFGSGDVGGRSQYPALMQDLGVPPGLGAPPGFPNAVPPRSGWQQPASLEMPSSDRSPGTPQWIGQGPSLPIVEPHEYPDPRFSSFHGRTYSVPLSPPRFDTTCPQGPSSLALSPSVISSPFESDAPMERGESAS
jgi:hypothetical protein